MLYGTGTRPGTPQSAGVASHEPKDPVRVRVQHPHSQGAAPEGCISIYFSVYSCELELNTSRMEAQYQPNTAESQAVVEEEGPYTPCEMVIGRSPDLVPTPEPDPDEQEIQWPRPMQETGLYPMQETGPHYPDELV